MMKLSKRDSRTRRHRRVRQKIQGTAERPRIAVFRSNRHIGAQAIDDLAGRTLVGISSVAKASEADGKNHCNCATATALGRALGDKLKAAGVSQVVFDRGGCVYHGVVKAFADGIRSADEENHFYF
jgi:large subunit ribosomal protein L18